MKPLTFAYYCSGHGYGHATRVSAFASYLRQLPDAPIVYIISSAPKHVFHVAVSLGALYRFAEIDPVIVQPLAYYVDRRKSIDVLKTFLSRQDEKIVEEVTWLKDNDVDCVLSDAAFLACKAANAARIPSALVTNFTFDSVYSYLSIRFPEGSSLNPDFSRAVEVDTRVSLLNDDPISPEELALLVKELHDGYRCAELLLRLPGNIPIPSFIISPCLPSYVWTDPELNKFKPEILASLSHGISLEELHQPVPFHSGHGACIPKPLPRKVVQAPLIVRHPSADIYTPSGRKRLLDSIGIPEHLQTPRTKILVVSFGGQVFRRPHSHPSSRSHSPTNAHKQNISVSHTPSSDSIGTSCSTENGHDVNRANVNGQEKRKDAYVHVVPPIATESHIWVPGAPPANKSPTVTDHPRFPPLQNGGVTVEDEYDVGTQTVDATSSEHSDSDHELSLPEQRFLPDDSWIAILCSATTASGKRSGSGSATGDKDDELPQNFFVAPRDVYMPDLTALGDVLLGKLGYGTTAECVDACTPFVYVPRPLFVEEHGLRRLLQNEGTGVELSREKYEAGDWADAVREAWLAGNERKAQKRASGDDGTRRKQGMQMAEQLLDWVQEWKRAERTLSVDVKYNGS